MPRKKSLMWNHFTETEEGSRAMCLHCSNIVSIKGGSLGNLKRHVILKHPTIDIAGTEPYPPHIWSIAKEVVINVDEEGNNYITNINTIETPQKSSLQTNQIKNDIVRVNKSLTTHKSKQIDEQLLKMIIKEYHPFSLVEDDEFKRLVSLLCPGYNLPSRKAISTNLLSEFYFTTVQKVKGQLQKVIAVSLTIDTWTSRNNQHFLTSTAHFIASSGELNSVSLGCVEFCVTDNAEYLSMQLKTIMSRWELEGKVVAVVSDDTNIIVESIEMCNWPHLLCFAHSLNVIVQSGLCCSDISVTINKLKATVKYFEGSSQALAKLHSVQVQMGLPELKLKEGIANLWTSMCEMLTRLIQNKDAVIFTLTILEDDIEPLTIHEWKLAECAMEVLYVFVQVAEEITSENLVSLSKIVLLVRSVNKRLCSFEKNSTILPEITSLIIMLKEKLNKHFSCIEENEILVQSTLLDPRFKKYGFSDDTKFLAAYTSLENDLNNLDVPEDRKSVSLQKAKESASSNASSFSLWEEFDCKVQEFNVTRNHSVPGVFELEKYVQEDLLDRKEDPLKWWKERSNIYPHLYEIVKKRLCIVATSVPCERIYSKAGQVFTNRRSSLTTSKLPQILFLNHNL